MAFQGSCCVPNSISITRKLPGVSASAHAYTRTSLTWTSTWRAVLREANEHKDLPTLCKHGLRNMRTPSEGSRTVDFFRGASALPGPTRFFSPFPSHVTRQMRRKWSPPLLVLPPPTSKLSDRAPTLCRSPGFDSRTAEHNVCPGTTLCCPCDCRDGHVMCVTPQHGRFVAAEVSEVCYGMAAG